MTQEEAVAQVREENLKSKAAAFDALRMLHRDKQLLKNAGFDSLGEATEFYITHTSEACEKRIQDFEKKYPG